MEFEVTRIIRAPRESVFAWCTTYDEADPARSKNPRFKTRKVLRSEGNIVEVEDFYEDTPVRRATVTLFPSERWEAQLEGGLWQGRGIYRLKDMPEGTELRITFQVKSMSPNATLEQL
ncbi:MAG: hypothetical protein ACE5KO_05590, partial [Candidatus Bathyarchaeia archaeon]